MKILRIIFSLLASTIFCNYATAQTRKELIFSSVKVMASKPDTLTFENQESSAKKIKVKLKGADKSSFTIISVTKAEGQTNKVVVSFNPSPDFIGIARAELQIKSKGKGNSVIALTGLATKGLEGENEPPLSRVVDALGYDINVGWKGLANHSRPELLGDEIDASLFKKAGAGSIEILPVARYSPDFLLPFGYYINTVNGPEKHEAGILAKRGEFPEHQTLFPAIASGSKFIDPGEKEFGFYATGPTHTAYSEDKWNMALFPVNAVRATRIYPVKTKAGAVIENTYLICYEEAKNGDYNDYVFVVKNIKPVVNDKFTTIFNGKDLMGWHSFLKGIGINADPDRRAHV